MTGAALTARIANQPHPEFLDDVGGLDFSAGMRFVKLCSGALVPHTQLHAAICDGAREAGLRAFDKRTLRQLFYRRAAESATWPTESGGEARTAAFPMLTAPAQSEPGPAALRPAQSLQSALLK